MLVFKQGFLKEGTSTCPIYCAYSLPNAVLQVVSPPCTYFYNIGGLITTADNNACAVPNVDVKIETSASPIASKTDQNGKYTQNRKNYLSYTITPSKDTKPLCGVSTLDIVLMTKHISGVQPIPDWWRLVAADVNNNGKITVADIVELRKMILGINTQFSSNTAWRFFDASKVPTSLIEYITIASLQKDELANNFRGVKIGDVSGNWCDTDKDNCINAQRPSEEQDIFITDIAAREGEEFDIFVKIGENQVPILYGTAFDFDRDAIEIIGVERAEIPYLTEDNFAINREENKVKMLWAMDGEEPVLFRQGQEFFKIKARAKREIASLENLVTLDESFENVTYSTDSEEGKALRINFRGAEYRHLSAESKSKTNNSATLNLAGDVLSINYYSTDSGNTRLSVYDLQGRLITQKNFTSQFGYNNAQVELQNQVQSEVYFYLLETPQYPISGKFVRISK